MILFLSVAGADPGRCQRKIFKININLVSGTRLAIQKIISKIILTVTIIIGGTAGSLNPAD